jgi:hypothetical protein
MPPKPPLDRSPPAVSWAGYALFGMLIVAGIAVLGVISFGSIFAVLFLAGLVLPIIVTFHYVLWGWWLGKAIQDAGEREQTPIRLRESVLGEGHATGAALSDVLHNDLPSGDDG